MKKLFVLFATGLLITLLAIPAFSAQLRVFVADISVVGAQNRDELKTTLQTLLSSRLNSDRIAAVGSTAEADAVITGSYVVIGKIFSMDALVKSPDGKIITRSFVQGDSQDELIPAIGKLADKLSAEIAKSTPASALSVPVISKLPSVAGKSDFIKIEQTMRPAPVGDFIKPADLEKGSSGGWASKRLPGAANLMAIGRAMPDGTREIILAEERRVSYYRQGAEMKLVNESEDFRNNEKIISLDTIDSPDGSLEIYLSMVRGYEISSQIWQVKDNKLVKVVEGLPYFFRSFSLAGGQKKLYAQVLSREGNFYGDVYEAVRSGTTISLKKPFKMPRFGNIYTFNQFRDKENAVYTVAINNDNYLIVFDKDLQEIWRSNDKFGGSELFFLKEDLTIVRTGETTIPVFLNQRIQVTSKGEILVGKNDGFWVLGNARSYKKGAVYCLTWNGSSLEEKWRTKDTQNYMPDYYLDESRNELAILQTVQRPGLTNRGASSLSIKKVE